MKVEVNFSKSYLLIFSILIVALLGGIFVYAYNSSPANPAVFGHSANEIEGVCRTDGTGCPAFVGSNIVGTLVFENPGTYDIIVPDGVTSVRIQAVGGGGAGGPSYIYGSQNNPGNGGGAGAYSQATFSVSAGFVGTAVVGSGSIHSNCYASGSYSLCSDVSRAPSGGESKFTDRNGQVKVKAVGGGGGGVYPWPWSGQCSSDFRGLGGNASLGTGDIKISGLDGTSNGGTFAVTTPGYNPKMYKVGQGGAGGTSTSVCAEKGADGTIIVIMYS